MNTPTERSTSQVEEALLLEPNLQFFSFAHLPAHLQEVSKPFCDLAWQVCESLPANDQRRLCIERLLEAKDAAVRARLWKDLVLPR
jgi:hypothetical protein